MNSNSEPVNPRMISRAAISSCDRSRKAFIGFQSQSFVFESRHPSPLNKLISRAVHGHQISGAGRVRFKFLAKPEDMIVHCPSRRVILITPYLAEKFLARNDPSRGGRGVKNRLDGHKFAKLPHKTTVFVR